MNQDDLSRARRYSYLICGAVFLSYIFVYFHRLCPSVVALDMQKAFGIGPTLLGVLGSAYFYPYGLMQLPVGLLADSWGPRKTISAFFLLAALGSLLMGLAGSLSWAVIGRVLVGVGVSTVYVCNFKILAEWFRPRQFMVAGGVFMAMGGVGALAAGTPMAFFSGLVGWKGTLVGVGLVSLVIAGLAYIIIRDRPSDLGLPDLASGSADPPAQKIGLGQGIKQVVTAARFWPLAIWAFMAVGIAFALGGMWLGPYLQQVYGMSRAQAGVYQSMFGVALVIGSPLQSYLANRYGRKPVLIGCSLLLLLLGSAFYMYPSGLSPQVLMVLVFLFFVAGGAPGSVVATVAKELFPRAIAGTAVGLLNIFPFFGGGIFQIVLGWLLTGGGDTTGAYTAAAFQNLFAFSVLCALGSLLAGLMVPETLPQADDKG
ncbi:MAG: MFS transporter [Desulfarculaceae bacterium]|jgi:sugar phosphate permease